MAEEKFFWSPAAHWKEENGEIIIGDLRFKGKVVTLFPQFYFIFQNKTSLEEATSFFEESSSKIIKLFFKDLVKKRILIEDLNTVKELFNSQSIIHKNEYEESYFLNAENVKKFKEKQLLRYAENNSDPRTIHLKESSNLPDFIEKRQSSREFDTSRIVSKTDLEQVLNAFRQKKELGKYYYASAGGLYPINIYLYIKKDRVEGMTQGLYLYNPYLSSLKLISEEQVTNSSHFFTNIHIFDQSAFSVYFTYSGDVNMPKYGGMGYLYGCIDCGIMIGLLNHITEYYGMGSCSIGEMNFDKIKHMFHMKKNEIFLQSVEVGHKIN